MRPKPRSAMPSAAGVPGVACGHCAAAVLLTGARSGVFVLVRRKATIPTTAMAALRMITLDHPKRPATSGASVGTMAAATKPHAFIQLPTAAVKDRLMSVAIAQATVCAKPAPPRAMLSQATLIVTLSVVVLMTRHPQATARPATATRLRDW